VTKKRSALANTSVFVIFSLVLLVPAHQAIFAATMGRTNLANAKLGLFVHYVFGLTEAAPGKPPLKNVNRFADDLNVNGIANMASAMGAQYVIFTAYHWRMTMLFPSRVWGGIFPNHVSHRDVISALAAALKAKGIALVLYVHPDDRHDFPLPMLNKLVRLGWTSRRDVQYCLRGREPHDPKWNRLYYRILNEIGRRYGTKISGYFEDDWGGGSNGNTVRQIMLRYTPHAAIWVNGFRAGPPATLIGGENWTLFNHNPAPQLYPTTSHMLAVVVTGNWGVWWAAKGHLNYTPQAMYRFFICSIATRGNHNGGVVYATSPFSNNQWEPGVRKGLAELGRFIKSRARSIYNTVPSRAYVSGDSIAQKPDWGVAVDSINGKTVYLHVLIPPKGRVLQIGRPADHVKFSSARLLNGRFLAISRSRGGYKLTLPAGVKWSAVDTVIALRVK
jgi:hypothetical protein